MSRHNDMVIDLAAKGMLTRYLSPSDWEALRIRLQDIYRKATGEPMAVVSVDHAPSHLPREGVSPLWKIRISGRRDDAGLDHRHAR